MQSQKQQSNEQQQDVSSLTIYVIFSILAVIIYTIVEQVISSITGVHHDTLTTCFYGVFGGELLCCALIKIFKLKELGKSIIKEEIENLLD